jgi:hypothetical protein
MSEMFFSNKEETELCVKRKKLFSVIFGAVKDRASRYFSRRYLDLTMGVSAPWKFNATPERAWPDDLRDLYFLRIENPLFSLPCSCDLALLYCNEI